MRPDKPVRCARPDRYGDHVLLQPLVIADAGVTPHRQHIHEAILDDNLDAGSLGTFSRTAGMIDGNRICAALDGTLSLSVPAGLIAEPDSAHRAPPRSSPNNGVEPVEQAVARPPSAPRCASFGSAGARQAGL
jgi:hypothetical protein